MTAWRDLNTVWFERHNGYRDPPEPPEFYTVELRRVIDIEGVRWVLVQDQDGEEFLVDEYDFDNPGMP